MKRFAIAALVAAVALAVTMPSAFAQTGGYGPGMMGGGYGMGPGMMGGHDMGPGMGMGPGMMGGCGMGPGMMGGGMGPGMMQGYHGAAGQLDLTDDQREKITKIHEALAMKHWELMGKMQEQRFVFRDMLASGKADDAAIGRAFKRMEELRQQMRGAGADAQKQADAVLTKEQRDQLQRGGSRTN